MAGREFDVEVEQRVALVMYGGISLAIYMNGIAREFLNLVVSTAHDESSGEAYLASDTQLHLKPSERRPILSKSQAVYRDLARLISDELRKGRASGTASPEIRVKFVVDILSGTSAGGLNALFLGKSLATNSSFDALETMWIKEGDISLLLDDDRAYTGLPGLTKKPARSVLSSRRMSMKLLEALHSMDSSPLIPSRSGTVELVNELDVHMTATDLIGHPISVRIGQTNEIPQVNSKDSKRHVQVNRESCDQLEAEHRAVFHFQKRTDPILSAAYGTSQRNDFQSRNNPFMAFVGRATSSIVPAFEPMQLSAMKECIRASGLPYVYDPGSWKHLYRPFWGDSIFEARDEEEREVALKAAIEQFEFRSFGDGGYLDKKPFGHALKQLRSRRADIPVKRRVFYVEPHPVTNEEVKARSNSVSRLPLSAAEHAKLALTLPGVQTISDRVSELYRDVRLAEKVNRLTRATTSGPGVDDDKQPPPNFALANRAYVESTADWLTEITTSILGYEPDSMGEQAIRHLIFESLELQFRSKPGQDTTDDSMTDPCLPGRAALTKTNMVSLDGKRLIRYFAWIRDVLESEIGNSEQCLALMRDFSTKFYEKVHRSALLIRIAEQGPLSKLGTDLSPQLSQEEIGAMRILRCLEELRLSRDELVFVAAGDHLHDADSKESPIDEASKRARLVLGIESNWDGYLPRFSNSSESRKEDASVRLGRTEGLERLFCELRRFFGIEDLFAEMEKFLAEEISKFVAVGPDFSERLIRRLSFKRFSAEDARTFPLIYVGSMSDSYALKLHRISPREATSRTGTRIDGVEKLSGTKLAHFGAFFTEAGRRNDILWGRLDAAEVIVNTYAPPGQASALLNRLHIAIIEEAEFSARNLPADDPHRLLLQQLGVAVVTEQPVLPVAAEAKREELAALTPRAIGVISQMLDDAGMRPGGASISKTLAVIARTCWISVEASVGSGLIKSVINRWFEILFTLSTVALVVLICLGKLGSNYWAVLLFVSLSCLWFLVSTIRKTIYNSWGALLPVSLTVTGIVGALQALFVAVQIQLERTHSFAYQSLFISGFGMVAGVLWSVIVGNLGPIGKAISSKWRSQVQARREKRDRKKGVLTGAYGVFQQRPNKRAGSTANIVASQTVFGRAFLALRLLVSGLYWIAIGGLSLLGYVDLSKISSSGKLATYRVHYSTIDSANPTKIFIPDEFRISSPREKKDGDQEKPSGDEEESSKRQRIRAWVERVWTWMSPITRRLETR